MTTPTPTCSGCYDSFSGPWCDNCDRWPCVCLDGLGDACCQDAAPGPLDGVVLHTGGCPNRCGTELPCSSPHLAVSDYTYPCAATKGHEGDCWIPEGYVRQGDTT